MRRLYVLRHAKSAWPNGVEDRNRPLSDSGKEHAVKLANRIQQENWIPDIVLCSPARRTRETADIVCRKMDIKLDEGLYLSSTGDLYETAKAVDDSYQSAMIVGHNPGMHGLVQMLVGEGDPEHINALLGGYKTGCLSVIDCDCTSWAEILPGANKLTDLVVGKELS